MDREPNDVDQEPDDEYLRTYEVADVLGNVNPKTVTRWAKEGKLPFLRTLGGHRRYPAARIRALAASLGYQPEPGDTADAADGLVDDLPPDPRDAPFGLDL